MNEKVTIFQTESKDILDMCSNLCFMTRAEELQMDAINRLEMLKDEASILKQEIIMLNDEDSANAMLSFEKIIIALYSELKMWVALKNDNPSEAWNYLVSAQGATRTAMQAHSIANNLENHAERLYLLEHLLFPPQTFCSLGAVIDPADCDCSICGQIYGECDHIRGKAYMGQMCSRIINHVKEVKEFSIVYNPGNKRCRVYRVGNTDTMTLRRISDVSTQKETEEYQDFVMSTEQPAFKDA